MDTTVDGDIEIAINLDPTAVVPIFSVWHSPLRSASLRTGSLGLVRWFDRNFQEIRIVFAIVILSVVLVFIVTKPPSLTAKEPLAIFACCLIAWFSLAAFTLWRHWYIHKKKTTSAKASSRSETATNKANNGGIAVEIVVEMLRN